MKRFLDFWFEYFKISDPLQVGLNGRSGPRAVKVVMVGNKNVIENAY